MKILHVIPSISPVHGGPSRAISDIARACGALGMEVEVATTDDDGPGRRMRDVALGQWMNRDGMKVRFFRKQTEFYKVSLPLRGWLRENAGNYDVVHIHAVFQHASVVAGSAARSRGVPYLVRPLGVLNRYGREKRRPGLKALSLALIEKPLLRRAAAIHFTSEAEREEAADLGLTTRSVVIPLGIDPEPFAKEIPFAPFLEGHALPASGKRVLFLSRLDPKKNVEVLLRAWRDVCRREAAAQLLLAGTGDPAYVQSLNALAAELGIAERICWLGQVEGESKPAAFAAADVYVLPSQSENFGIAAVEAMAAGKACILSPGVAVAAEAAPAGAAVVCDPEPEKLAAAIGSLLNDREQRQRLGFAAQALVHERFSLEAMGKALGALYEEVVTKKLKR